MPKNHRALTTQPKRPIDTLTEQEEILLLNTIKNWSSLNNRPWIQHRNYTMTLLMLDAGLRVGETCQLRINQLYYASAPVGCLNIPAKDTKNRWSRDIPITVRLSDAIEQMNTYFWSKMPIRPESYAFYTHSPMEPLTTRQVQRVINYAARASIGRKLHPHALRHTFATKLMRKCSVRVVQSLLGHKSLQSTQVYTHPNHRDLQNAIDSLNTVKD